MLEDCNDMTDGFEQSEMVEPRKALHACVTLFLVVFPNQLLLVLFFFESH